MSLIAWSWLFLVLYIGLMVGIGVFAGRKVKQADDFATARGSYGPVFLAFAFAASTASGATFLGSPALSYEWGFAANWGNFLYPIGLYFGVLICMRLVATAGNRFGNRSIPEYLGDRYQSEGIRVLVSLLSLVLFFYLAGQLVSGLVMFEIFLGLTPFWALVITGAVLLVYVVLGGAHADILTDGLQGFLMLALSIIVVLMFLFGESLYGGLGGLTDALSQQDENLVTPLNPSTPLYHSWWSIFVIVIAHMPLGLLPHLGNKLWALKVDNDRMQFVKLAFLFGLMMAMISVGGLMARVVFGDALYDAGNTPNAALPLLFVEFFPTWLAALVGVGVLSAIMSTADGLVVSSSQIIANDLYRRTWVPFREKRGVVIEAKKLDARVLTISRIATIVVLVLCMCLAWALLDKNIAIIVWIGNGGMMAAFAGPLVVGALWRGVTKQGAYTGLLAGFGTFSVLFLGLIDPAWFSTGGAMHGAAVWLQGESPNPYSCAAMGEIVSVIATVVVSRLTRPLPSEHIDAMFGARTN